MELEDYFHGKSTMSRQEEEIFLMSNGCKNTGALAEKYVSDMLSNIGVKFKKNIRIHVGDTYIVPDFYLYELDIILEIKSRSYNCPGTASEKIDNIPRKYSKIISVSKFKSTKVVVVFCAFEAINPSSLELVIKNTEYSRDFTQLCKKYNVVEWILVSDLSKMFKCKIKPIIKWVGGKCKISKKILEQFPTEYNSYHEPFIGGGYIGLSLSKDIDKSFSDINFKLMNCYSVVKYDVDGLINELQKPIYSNDKASFLEIRKKFNSGELNDVELAASFLFLNKCCFNGMYRENKSGGFNVPFGDMKNPLICDSNLLHDVSKFLQDVNLECKSYTKIDAVKDDLVYFDPPYHKTFSDYSSSGFSEDDHIVLKKFVDELTTDGVKVILSNSSTEFVKELYKDYKIIVVDTKYSIGATTRKSVEELLIKNF